MNPFSNPFKRKDGKPWTRGDRISRNGARLFYVGFAGIFIGGWSVEALHAPGPVILAVLILTFAMAITGVVLLVAGNYVDNRALAEYRRQVKAGERPPWKPGDSNPLG